ncbi:hypothetical protein SAMN06265795_10851 [Noviherbaspirillum humi]|uniref:Uncharacterized protein n=1 Tax=Noviherbaspirillum humi TaxID=1688639 RepID=A0A239I0T1_9BURK|nr:hypothetical protein [Noviherbaspirillum humi]SNS87109.1 hypothetical protein SAMN06265795_10851 [Noviherbaspirillum humi]
MNNDLQGNPNPSKADKAGPRPARTEENAIGVDDIGLESGIQAEEARQIEEIRPEQAKRESGN